MTSQNKNETNLVVDNQPSGCEIAKKLWSVALECKIEHPGINGAAGRARNCVKCSNDCINRDYNGCLEHLFIHLSKIH